VGGSIQGNVNTTGRLEILATGKVFGDIVVGSLIIDEGGILRGKSAVHSDESAASTVSVGMRAEPVAA
jgi:cytoskeletal protein CcmA (bactofilin family)